MWKGPFLKYCRHERWTPLLEIYGRCATLYLPLEKRVKLATLLAATYFTVPRLTLASGAHRTTRSLSASRAQKPNKRLPPHTYETPVRHPRGRYQAASRDLGLSQPPQGVDQLVKVGRSVSQSVRKEGWKGGSRKGRK